MRMFCGLVLTFVLGTVSLGAAAPNPATTPAPASDLARLLGTWDCEGGTPGNSTVETYARAGEDDVAFGNSVHTSSGASGFVSETLRFVPATATWNVTALPNRFFDGLNVSAPVWSPGTQWILAGTEVFRKKTMPVRIVYTDLGAHTFRREHQVQVGGAWRDDAAYVCRRPGGAAEPLAAATAAPSLVPAIGIVSAPSPSPVARRQTVLAVARAATPWPFAPWRFAPTEHPSVAAAPKPTPAVVARHDEPAQHAAVTVASAPVHDHAFALVGTWACRTPKGDESTHVYTLASNGAIALRNRLSLNGRIYEIDETYEYDADRNTWFNVTAGGAYRGAAPRWQGDAWTFDGVESEGTPSEVRMTYTMLGSTQFRRDFARTRDGTWTPYLSETCQRRA